MEFAEFQFRHSATTPDGGEAGDHIESSRRQLAQMPGRSRRTTAPVIPEAPPFPEELAYLWSWFNQISLGMPISGMAPPTISWDTLQAWQRLTGVGPLEPWEAQTLVTLSMLRAGIQSETRRNQSTAANPPSHPTTMGKRAR